MWLTSRAISGSAIQASHIPDILPYILTCRSIAPGAKPVLLGADATEAKRETADARCAADHREPVGNLDKPSVHEQATKVFPNPTPAQSPGIVVKQVKLAPGC